MQPRSTGFRSGASLHAYALPMKELRIGMHRCTLSPICSFEIIMPPFRPPNLLLRPDLKKKESRTHLLDIER